MAARADLNNAFLSPRWYSANNARKANAINKRFLFSIGGTVSRSNGNISRFYLRASCRVVNKNRIIPTQKTFWTRGEIYRCNIESTNDDFLWGFHSPRWPIVGRDSLQDLVSQAWLGVASAILKTGTFDRSRHWNLNWEERNRTFVVRFAVHFP